MSRPILVDSIEAPVAFRLPDQLPPTFKGLFCSFEHVIWVEWSTLANPKSAAFKEIPIPRIYSNPKWFNAPLCPWMDPIDLETLSSDDDEDEECLTEAKLKALKATYKPAAHSSNQQCDASAEIRELCDNPNTPVFTKTSFNNTLKSKIILDDCTLGSICIRRLMIQSGTCIEIAFEFTETTTERIERITVALECIESVNNSFLISETTEPLTFFDKVREQTLPVPPGISRLEILIPVPPDLQGDYESEIVRIQWRLLFKIESSKSSNVTVNEIYFPIKIVSSKLF